MSAPTIRRFQEGDETDLQLLLDRCFGRFETWTADRVAELTVVPGSDTSELWVALDGSRPVGFVRVFGVPQAGSYVIRELAVDTEAQEPVARDLLDIALEHLKGLDPSGVRGSTLDVAPYPEAYRQKGFTAVRRALTLVWDLTAPRSAPAREDSVVVGEALRHAPEHLAELYVEGMRPYWDWLIDERGGTEAYKERVAAHIDGLADDGSDEMWLAAEIGGAVVGLAFVTQLDEEEADMGGVYVLPAYRNQGAGSALMRATLSELRQRAKKRLVVPETITSLDSDLPSIRLYEQSGARVRAEYLHLQLDIATLRH
ncbi:MAG: GNAT family N-acetyltransferase [Actinobacteria bacterium]|nr:GNAT family N-acetyltransferase [Actinomycetota bacterium]